jgi:hypothetical protein
LQPTYENQLHNSSPKMFVSAYETTHCHNPEHHNLNNSECYVWVQNTESQDMGLQMKEATHKFYCLYFSSSSSNTRLIILRKLWRYWHVRKITIPYMKNMDDTFWTAEVQ